ncbi:MAG: hypothetical protein QOI48_1623 [Solirubrobacteraceae bacterium]|nr:hypothetical protein [Solirubrobacteraceae bacterium]
MNGALDASGALLAAKRVSGSPVPHGRSSVGYVSVRSEPTWQAISALATIATLIDQGLSDAREHYAMLFAAQPDPYAFDATTMARVKRANADSLALCDVYEQQLRRWRKQRLTDAQQHEVARLDSTTRELRLMLTEILALADELASSSTERQLSKADAELGLEHPFG